MGVNRPSYLPSDTGAAGLLAFLLESQNDVWHVYGLITFKRSDEGLDGYSQKIQGFFATTFPFSQT
jgi:hypothetical protein